MTNKELYKYMDDLLKMHLTEQSKQNCVYICDKLTKWFATNAVTVNVNNWLNDYSQGFDTARTDIKEWCINQKQHILQRSRSEWNSGYISALIDVIEYIERM